MLELPILYVCEAPMGHFFHLRAGEQLILDAEGLDLPRCFRSPARGQAVRQGDFGRSNQSRSGHGAGRFRDLR